MLSNTHLFSTVVPLHGQVQCPCVGPVSIGSVAQVLAFVVLCDANDGVLQTQQFTVRVVKVHFSDKTSKPICSEKEK